MICTSTPGAVRGARPANPAPLPCHRPLKLGGRRSTCEVTPSMWSSVDHRPSARGAMYSSKAVHSMESPRIMIRLMARCANGAPQESCSIMASTAGTSSAAGHDARHQPDPVSFGGVDEGAGQGQLHGPGQPDDPGEKVVAPSRTEDAPPHEVAAEARLLAGDADVTCHRQVESHADRSPVDGGDDRLFATNHFAEQRVAGLIPVAVPPKLAVDPVVRPGSRPGRWPGSRRLHRTRRLRRLKPRIPSLRRLLLAGRRP